VASPDGPFATGMPILSYSDSPQVPIRRSLQHYLHHANKLLVQNNSKESRSE
jgi:hypothetical protein